MVLTQTDMYSQIMKSSMIHILRSFQKKSNREIRYCNQIDCLKCFFKIKELRFILRNLFQGL